MPQVILDETQAAIVRDSDEPVEIIDRDGKWLGVVAGRFNRCDLEEARQRALSAGPWHPTREILDHLRALDVN